jgi:prepilin-type processing-associated H-X9-DG protein
MNNLRQLALAALQYEGKFRRFPGLVENLNQENFVSHSGYQNTTWPVLLMPNLEREQIYDVYMKGQLSDFYIEGFTCPSDATKTHSGPEMSYVANGGQRVGAALQKPANGPFINRIVHPKMSVTEGNWRDGREYTLAFSENYGSSTYDTIGWQGFTSDDATVDQDLVFKDFDDRMWTPVFYWWGNGTAINQEGRSCAELPPPPPVCKESPNHPRRYNSGSCDRRCADMLSTWARPASYHSGGVNVAFGGGRCTFLREDIKYEVYIALMTLYEKGSNSPNPEYILEDTDLQ